MWRGAVRCNEMMLSHCNHQCPLLLPILTATASTTATATAATAREPELLEDGILLWLVALRNAPAPHPPLLQLFPLLLQAMAMSTGEGARGWL
jgi:hypothetical protein